MRSACFARCNNQVGWFKNCSGEILMMPLCLFVELGRQRQRQREGRHTAKVGLTSIYESLVAATMRKIATYVAGGPARGVRFVFFAASATAGFLAVYRSSI